MWIDCTIETWTRRVGSFDTRWLSTEATEARKARRQAKRHFTKNRTIENKLCAAETINSSAIASLRTFTARCRRWPRTRSYSGKQCMGYFIRVLQIIFRGQGYCGSIGLFYKFFIKEVQIICDSKTTTLHNENSISQAVLSAAPRYKLAAFVRQRRRKWNDWSKPVHKKLHR